MKISVSIPHVESRVSPARAKNTVSVEAPPRDSFQLSDPLKEAFDGIPTPVHSSQTRLLSDNAESWNARWRMLEGAQEQISLTTYTWDNDIFGKALLGHVFLKSREGVSSRLMVDAVGDPVGRRGFKAHWGGKDYLQELVRLPNAEAKVYHPHYKKPLNAILHPTQTHGLAANHDKILEVDGRQGITGGRNIGHHYFIDPKDDPIAWRDLDVQLTGESSAKELRDAFDEEFNLRYLNHTIKADRFGNWVKRDIELLGAYSMMDSWIKNQGEALTPENLLESALAKLPELGLDREPSKRELKALRSMAQELTKYRQLEGSYHQPQSADIQAPVKVIDRSSAVGSGPDEMNQSLLQLVKGAQESILIQNPYFVLTDPMLDAFKEASDRGVSIEIDTNTPSSSDSAFTQVFFLNDWKKIAATTENLSIQGATGERKHHGKAAVIDDRISVVGTYNLDLISSETNSEVAAVIYSEDFASELKASMENDRADPSMGYRPYTLRRDSEGRPLSAEGEPALNERGELRAEPEALFGPEHHLPAEKLQAYDKKIKRWNWMREHLPQLKSLRRHV